MNRIDTRKHRRRDYSTYDAVRNKTPGRRLWQSEYDRRHRDHKNLLRRQRYALNPGPIIARVSDRQKRDPLGAVIRSARHRAKLLGLEMSDVSKRTVTAMLEEQRGLCFYCREPLARYDIDHKTPLARGGDDSRENLCLACPPCNRRKQALTAVEFMAVMV